MKVLHVIPSIDPLSGGPNQSVRNMAAALRDRGIEADIAATDHGLTGPAPAASHIFKCSGWTSRIVGFLYSPDLLRWLERHAADYEWIHIHTLFAPISAAAAAIARKRRVPYAIRTTGQLSSWAFGNKGWKKRPYFAFVEKRALQGAEWLHATSEGEAQDIRKAGITAPIRVISLGIEPAQTAADARRRMAERLSLEAEAGRVIVLGRLDAVKRPEFMVEVLRYSAAAGRPFHLIYVGPDEGGWVPRLKRQSAAAGIQQWIRFVGYTDGTDKEILIQGSDLLVLPSHSENFGHAAAEAAARGVPVFVTPGVQLGADLERWDAGRVLPADSRLWSEAIHALLGDETERKKLGANGKRMAAGFSWSAAAERLEEAYRIGARDCRRTSA